MPPATRFDHLERLSTRHGVYEHALGDQPRIDHGMCVDDVARALVVAVREPNPSSATLRAAGTYLDFLLDAQHEDGRMHNRSLQPGSWSDEASTDDHWGRAVWALAIAAESSHDAAMSEAALRGAARAMRATSPWPRASAYAALGAGRLHERIPDDSRRLLLHARTVLGVARPDPVWPWPEDTLTYANAVLPEAMIVVGDRLDDPVVREEGLDLLGWLVRHQLREGHLSLVPAAGRGRGDHAPGFDQQPIEAACLAEASATALRSTGDPRWAVVIDTCHRWFDGDNDAGIVVHDPATGAGYDGLEPSSVNQNRGAESTLAWMATQQLARACTA
jgi:hypothetical protein